MFIITENGNRSKNRKRIFGDIRQQSPRHSVGLVFWLKKSEGSGLKQGCTGWYTLEKIKKHYANKNIRIIFFDIQS